MMNKQKPDKAWSWKVMAFLPLFALLLMAFGRTAESGPSAGSRFSYIGKASSPDSTKQWSEADFLSIKDLSKLIEMRKSHHWLEPKITIRNQNGKNDTIIDPYNRTLALAGCDIQIDSKSRIWTNNHSEQRSLNELQKYIRTFLDYQSSDKSTRQGYIPITINGLEKMMPQYLLTISSDKNTPLDDYQRMLNIIGNTILEIRGEYSIEIFNLDYSKLSLEQKNQIDLLIPLIARFEWTPRLRSNIDEKRESFYIEVRVEGIVLSSGKKFLVEGYSSDDRSGYLSTLDERTSTLDEMRKEVEKFIENNPNGMFSVLVAKGSSEGLLKEIKSVLNEEKVFNVGYSTFDPVYSYVEQGPEFPGGKAAFKEWLRLNIQSTDTSHIQSNERMVHVNFVVESDGKISAIKISGEVTKDMNAENEAKVAKLVNSVREMPEWIPGRQNGIPVRVLYGLSVYL